MRKCSSAATDEADYRILVPGTWGTTFFCTSSINHVLLPGTWLLIARLFTRHDPTRGSFNISRVGSGRVRRCSKRHVSGRVNKFSNLAGRVRSGQKVFSYRASGRIGSRGFEILWAGWGLVESGHEVSKCHRSSRVMKCQKVTGRAGP